ncbi:hypothetical protein ILYODFUR_002344 [Ilyodon furcidens]|uniref:Uncharacterized protein n=1 Tax=Ilyodon furcidens TaxID=33524 RepID=A0ABV0SXA9_9TELE
MGCKKRLILALKDSHSSKRFLFIGFLLSLESALVIDVSHSKGLPASPPQAEPRTSELIQQAPLLLEEAEALLVVIGQKEA